MTAAAADRAKAAEACSEPQCTTTLQHHVHTDADGRSWCCGPYPYTTQPKPLTALEWLRVTHADTLSGRRIEEAVAEARAPYDRLTAELRALAEEWEGAAERCSTEATDLRRHRFPDSARLREEEARELRARAARLRGLVTGNSEEEK